jgi:hypothetical protein
MTTMLLPAASFSAATICVAISCPCDRLGGGDRIGLMDHDGKLARTCGEARACGSGHGCCANQLQKLPTRDLRHGSHFYVSPGKLDKHWFTTPKRVRYIDLLNGMTICTISIAHYLR